MDEYNRIADLALFAFVKVQLKIFRHPSMTKYKRNLELNRRMPNFQVKIGCGLHMGWAIEGAIGSEYKIDASYLSPNVNLVMKLEAATKMYGTGILISGEMFNILSLEVGHFCRHIDTVIFPSMSYPTELYTIDFDN